MDQEMKKLEGLYPSNYRVESVSKVQAYKVKVSKLKNDDGSVPEYPITREVIIDDLDKLKVYEI